jgi:hypothetical protein
VTTARVIVVTTSAMTAEMIGVIIDVARTTTTAKTRTARSDLHRHMATMLPSIRGQFVIFWVARESPTIVDP